MLTSCIALFRQLGGLGWSAGATTLWIATLALVHPTASCRVPAWCDSTNT